MDKEVKEVTKEQDMELKRQLERINWPILYGNVRLQLRDGKVTIVFIERTVKFD